MIYRCVPCYPARIEDSKHISHQTVYTSDVSPRFNAMLTRKQRARPLPGVALECTDIGQNATNTRPPLPRVTVHLRTGHVLDTLRALT